MGSSTSTSSTWLRTQGTPEGNIRFPFPSQQFKAADRKVPPAVIPRSVFEGLPADALIGMEWRVLNEEMR